MIETELSIYILIFFAALIAGFIDSIAGGGGLIATPVLLLVGMNPLEALATNKLQAVFGTSTASLNYRKTLKNTNSNVTLYFILSFFSSIAGTLFITKINSDLLFTVLPVLLIAIALFFAFKKDLDNIERKVLANGSIFILFVPLIAFYDGAIGPGTGSFFMIAFVTMKGLNLINSTYNTKILNFASNLGSLLTFLYFDLVNITFGLIMGLGQILGAYIGSNLTLSKGSKIIKPTLVVVSIIMSMRIIIN